MRRGGFGRARWLAPLVFFQVYLLTTVLLFFWGPWPWQVKHPDRLAAYLMAAQAAIAIGYLMAWQRLTQVEPLRQTGHETGAAIKLAAVATLILMVPTSLSRTGATLPDVMAGISNAGAVYNANFERLAAGNPYVALEYLRILLAPVLVGLMPLAVVYWTSLTWPWRLACLAGIAFNLSIYVATGTNKGIADFVITLPWLVYLGGCLGTLRLPVSWRTMLVVFGVLLAGFLAFFGAGQAQREGGVGELGVFNTGADLIYADREKGLPVSLGDSQRIIYESLTRYTGQGYQALSMAMELDDRASTWGFGHSMFLARNADAYFGTDHFTRGSLPGLLEEQAGWGMLALWHSIYPWLASDVGFGGAILVMAGFGWLLGLSWGRALQGAGHRWVVLAYLLLVLFYYVPANNQVFQTAETCAAFLLLVIGLVLSGPRAAAAQVPSESASQGSTA